MNDSLTSQSMNEGARMINKVNKSIALDLTMIAEIETRMKADGISMAELVRRGISLYLNNGEQPDSKDSEHKPPSSSLSDMLNDSDFS